MAQAAHAATAVLHVYRDEEAVKEYHEDLQGMRKVSRSIPTISLYFLADSTTLHPLVTLAGIPGRSSSDSIRLKYLNSSR